jgi:hypothetical protein
MDPEHNAYYTLLKPGTKVRLRATWATVTYDLFTGYLEQMVQHFGNSATPRDALMVWTLVDGLSILAAAGVPSAWEVNARTANAKVWYRFNELSGPTLFDNIGAAHGLYAGSGIVYGVTSTGALAYPPDEGDFQAEFPAGNYAYLPPAALPQLGNWSMTFMYTFPIVPTSAVNILYQASYPQGLQVILDTSGRLQAWVRNAAGTVTASVLTPFGQYGTGMLPTIVAEVGQPLKVYAGDFLLATGVGTGHSLPNAGAVVALPTVVGENWKMDEILFYDRALTVAELTKMLEAYGGWSNPVTGTPGEPVAARVTHVLDAVGWSAILRDITTEAPGRLKAHKAGSALSILQAIEATIEGRLWVDPSGILRLENHTELDRAPYTDVQGAFTDTGLALGYVGVGPYTLGWDLLTNVIRRHNEDFVISARDATSIAAYGLRDMTDVADVDSLYQTLELEADLASYRLAHYKDPVRHVDGLKVFPSQNPAALYPVVLGLDLAERISFARTPQGIGAPLTHEAIVEGIKVDISPKKWVFEYKIDAAYALKFFRFDITLWDSPDWRFTA